MKQSFRGSKSLKKNPDNWISSKSPQYERIRGSIGIFFLPDEAISVENQRSLLRSQKHLTNHDE